MENKDDLIKVFNLNLPPMEAMVLAICATFQCLAYVDEKGVWRNFFGKQEIQAVVTEWRAL